MKKIQVKRMVLETYFFATIILATVFMVAGFRSETPHPKWLIIVAGGLFLSLGLIMQTDGIEREVNYQVIRNEFDQNRVQDLNVTSEILQANSTNDVPPVGVKFDKGLWIIAKLFEFVLGWGNILIGFFLMVTGYMREFKEGRRNE